MRKKRYIDNDLNNSIKIYTTKLTDICVVIRSLGSFKVYGSGPGIKGNNELKTVTSQRKSRDLLKVKWKKEWKVCVTKKCLMQMKVPLCVKLLLLLSIV